MSIKKYFLLSVLYWLETGLDSQTDDWILTGRSVGLNERKCGVIFFRFLFSNFIIFQFLFLSVLVQ